jgi:hypothetical protein
MIKKFYAKEIMMSTTPAKTFLSLDAQVNTYSTPYSKDSEIWSESYLTCFFIFPSSTEVATATNCPPERRKSRRGGDCSVMVREECLVQDGLEGYYWWEVDTPESYTTAQTKIKQLRVACRECT